MSNQRGICTIVLAAVLFLALAGISARLAGAREITDMAGRTITLPDSIRKVYAPSPYGSYIMYSVDPSMLSGLNLPIRDEDKKYFPKEVQGLPLSAPSPARAWPPTSKCS